MKFLKTSSFVLTLLVGFALFVVQPATASILTIGGAETTGSGAGGIAGDAIIMNFQDIGLNTVQLTIDFQGGAGVDSGAFLNDLVFNVNDALSGFMFSHVSGVATHASSPTYSKNSTSLSPRNGFDILFNYPPPGPAAKFFVGMSSVYNISAVGLNSNSFDFSNTGNQHKAFVHINAVDNGQSGKFGDTLVPEPGSLMIWGMFLGLCTVVSPRRRKIA